MRPERAHHRIKRRVNCRMAIGGSQYVGLAQDLSPGGFFVQTSARLDVGSRVEITLHDSAGGAVAVHARVANRRRIDPRLAAVTRAGVGCAVEAPPEAYYQLLGSLTTQ